MKSTTKSTDVARPLGPSHSAGDAGFSLGGLVMGAFEKVRCLGIVAFYLAGGYGDDRSGVRPAA